MNDFSSAVLGPSGGDFNCPALQVDLRHASAEGPISPQTRNVCVNVQATPRLSRFGNRKGAPFSPRWSLLKPLVCSCFFGVYTNYPSSFASRRR